ncbi:hypothetical protein [Botrimarina sp.]|uniref:hypothetical protein n=1 Tax=Botrimarina sp. TaxID=2795802 RepID=UPI0032F03CB6
MRYSVYGERNIPYDLPPRDPPRWTRLPVVEDRALHGSTQRRPVGRPDAPCVGTPGFICALGGPGRADAERLVDREPA